jgi:DNA polymerase III delta prime subunit
MNERKRPSSDDAVPEPESGTVRRPPSGTSVSIGTQAVDAGGVGVRLGSGSHRDSIHINAENISVNSGSAFAFHTHHTYVGRLSAEDRARRHTFIRNVRRHWIQGVLQHPVQGPDTHLIRLNTVLRPDAVDNPFRRPARSGAAPQVEPPSDVAIEAKLDQNGPTMLLLGQPGSGKTTTLLQLAEALLAAAESDDTKPIPVLFSLSSWRASDKSIQDWAIREFRQMFSMPVDLATRWLAEGQVLLLLDGLDEVAQTHRASCVDGVNTYAATAGLSGLVVSCRAQEYAQLGKRLQVNTALEVLPLSASQSEALLRGAGATGAGLVALLDSAGPELSASPLMLSAVSRITRTGGERLERIHDASPEERQRDVMQTYVETMLEVRGHSWPADIRARFRHVTKQLASCMRDNSETVFAQERLQPSWLVGERDIRRYLWSTRALALCLGWLILSILNWFNPIDERIANTAVRVMGVLVSLAIVAPIVAILAASTPVAWRDTGSNRLLAVLRTVLWAAIVYPGVLPAAQRLTGSARSDVRLTEVRVWSWKAWRERLWRWSWISSLAGSLFVAMLFASLGGKTEAELAPVLAEVKQLPASQPSTLVMIGIAAMALLAVFAVAMYFLLRFLRRFESRFIRSLVCLSLVVGFTLLSARGEMKLSESALPVFIVGVLFLVFSAFMAAPIAGLATRQLTELGRSGGRLREAWVTTLSFLAAAVCVVAVTLCFTPAQDMAPDAPNLGRQAGQMIVSTAVSVGPALAFFCGGFDLCCYYVLRRMLHKRGILAADVQRFLEAGVDAMILQRVGGSYRFVHEHIQRVFIETPAA